MGHPRPRPVLATHDARRMEDVARDPAEPRRDRARVLWDAGLPVSGIGATLNLAFWVVDYWRRTEHRPQRDHTRPPHHRADDLPLLAEWMD